MALPTHKGTSALPCLDAVFSELPARLAMPWHRHRHPYLAIVLEGEFDEVGEHGRRRLGPGSVAVHEAYCAHSDQIGRRPVRILNVDGWPGAEGLPPFAQVDDLDELRRQRCLPDLLIWLQQRIRPATEVPADWPDLLAKKLREDPSLSLGEWALAQGLRSDSVSRGFRQAYGVSPKQFRAIVRARRAWAQVTNSRTAMSGIAQELGYADQAHMCRDVTLMSGRSPRHWRLQTGFKTNQLDSPRKVGART